MKILIQNSRAYIWMIYNDRRLKNSVLVCENAKIDCTFLILTGVHTKRSEELNFQLNWC